MSKAASPIATRIGDIVTVEDRTIRRRAITRPLVLKAALELIDADGIRACTVQALATRLGVTPRALYRHVADKDDLLRGVAQAVLSEIVLPDPSWPWPIRLRHTGLELRRVLQAHPAAAALCTNRPSVFPAVIPIADVVIGAFAETGLPAEMAIRFAAVLFNYTVGYSIAEADYSLHLGDDPIEDPLGGIAPDRVPWAAAHVAFFRRFANEGLYASDEQYALGLDLLLKGLVAQ